MTVSQPWIFATKPVAECGPCSNEIFSVRHPHITNLGLQGGGQANILLGSSTLHNVWRCPAFRGVQQFHHDIIIGGRVHDSHYSYLQHSQGAEGAAVVVVACGNNNIPTSDTGQDIIVQLLSLVMSIKRQNKNNQVVLASLLYAPKYCDQSLPASRNMLEKVRTVNRWIRDFNSDETGVQLDLGQYGVRGDPTRGDHINHCYTDWREPAVEKKLHLTDRVKNEIAEDLVRVFKRLHH